MKKVIIVLLALMLCSCAWTSIKKQDGTEITHGSLFVNTKNVDMTDSDTGVSIGNQTISLEALQEVVNLLKAASKSKALSNSPVNKP
jgi:hypothetical protein